MQADITFEPTRIGESFRDTLIVTSPVGGEYRCPVAGRCIPPKPQGPFAIKGKGSIRFKNVFTEQTEFHFTVDNSGFNVKSSEVIPAKKSTDITISFSGKADEPKTAKLIVTCKQSQSPWVYYLTGS